MKHTRSSILMLAAALFAAALLAVAPVTASVFQRLGRGDGTEDWLRRLPGRLLYSAVVEVNGAAASVAALALDGAAAVALRQHLRQTAESLGRVVEHYAGDGVERTDTVSGDRRRMLLALTPPGGSAMLLAVDLFVKDGKPADAVATWNELRQRYPAFAESRRDDPAVRALPAAK